MTEPVRPSDRVNWNRWAQLANDVTKALDHLDQRFLFSKRSAVAKELWEKGYRKQSDEQWAVIELSLNLSGPPPDNEPHPESTPVGPFGSRQEADDWAEALCRSHGGGSWTTTAMVPPS